MPPSASFPFSPLLFFSMCVTSPCDQSQPCLAKLSSSLSSNLTGIEIRYSSRPGPPPAAPRRAPEHIDRHFSMKGRVKCTGGVGVPRRRFGPTQPDGGLQTTNTEPFSTSDLPSSPPRTLLRGGMPAAVTSRFRPASGFTDRRLALGSMTT